MRSFEEFSEKEQAEAFVKAIAWDAEHKMHVIKLVRDAETAKVSYSPSGSDCFRPELWKPAHWKWFYENCIRLNEIAKKESI